MQWFSDEHNEMKLVYYNNCAFKLITEHLFKTTEEQILKSLYISNWIKASNNEKRINIL